MGSFSRVGPCCCVSTSGSFDRVGPVSRVGLSGRVGPYGHVEQFDQVEPSGLIGLFGSVPTLKGWFGYLTACVGNDLSRLHGRFFYFNRYPKSMQVPSRLGLICALLVARV